MIYAGESGIAAIVPSGDTTGVTDAANILNAVGRLPASGGRITLAASGTWYIKCGQVVINQTGVYIDAPGCYIKAVGAGDVFRMYDSSAYGPRIPKGGGGITGFPMIDGAATTGNSCAVHAGDILQLQVFAQARNFTAGTTSKGFWFDNQWFWTEQLNGHVYAQSCATGVMFDNSTGTSVNAAATGSFERATIDCFVENNSVGDGVTLNNGAIMIGQRLGIYGNFAGTGATSYSVLRITGSNAGGSSGLGYVGQLTVDVELDSNSATIPKTITFGSGANFLRCSGYLNFSGSLAFGTSNAAGNFQFTGPVFGDANLNPLLSLGNTPFTQTLTGNGQTIFTGTLGINKLGTSAAFTGLILAAGTVAGQIITIINNSGSAQTFAAAGTSNVAGGTGVTIAANTAPVFTWDATASLWYPSSGGSGVTIDPTASDIQPDGVRIAGATGLAADAGHVHAENANQTNLLAPAGALAESIPRIQAQAAISPSTGQVTVTAIPLPKGTVVTNITLCTGGAIPSGVTHGWFALLDSTGKVLAVSADTAAGWNNASLITLAMGAAFTVATAGLYYLAASVTATGMPTFMGFTASAGQAYSRTPVLTGTAGTQNAPPAVNAVLTIAAGTSVAYGYVS